MKIVTTSVKNYSLQFKTPDEAHEVLDHFAKLPQPQLHELADKMKHRLSSQYAHDDIMLTTVIFNNEIPELLQGLSQVVLPEILDADQSASKPTKPSKWKRWFSKDQ